ncbi:hypothetical protein ACROYT_G038970 [Oculina patagonica]
MRTPMNFLLVNLAVADMIVGVFSTFRFLNDPFKNLQGTTGADVICSLLTGGSFIWTGILASVLFLVLIATERYSAVLYPLQHKTGIISKKMNAIIAVCWTYAILWNVPTFSLRRYDDKTGRCFLPWPSPHLGKARAVYWIITTAIIPVIIMGYLYIQIVRKLWATSPPRSPSYERARRKVTRMTLIISMIYIMTWIPNSVIFLLLQFSSHVTPDSPADQIGILLVTFNSCINPIVYSLHSTPFSKSLKNIVLSCRPRCKRNAVRPSPPDTQHRVDDDVDVDVTSYRNEAFVENRIESRLSERSQQSIRSDE